MNSDTPRGFFAYPSRPPAIGEIIRTAVQSINDGGFGHIRTWEDTKIGGRVIIHEILKAIEDSQFLCVDLTGLNLNVMFELGYAIGRNKTIFPILDDSFPSNKSLFEQLRILTTIGYTPYQNVRHIVQGFYKEQPYNPSDTLFQQLIQPSLQQSRQKSCCTLRAESTPRLVSDLLAESIVLQFQKP